MTLITKAGSPTLFTFSCSLVGISDFASLCRNVYFPTEDFSQATFAIVNSGLYNLFMEEYSLTEDSAKRAEYQSYALMAQTNLETYLANLPLFLSAKVENVQALLLGVGRFSSSRTIQADSPGPICNRLLSPFRSLAPELHRGPALPNRRLPSEGMRRRRPSPSSSNQGHPLLAGLHLGQGVEFEVGPLERDPRLRHQHPARV